MNKRVIHSALCIALALVLGCASTTNRYKPARVASKHALDYPLSAQLDRIEGEVMVGVFVDADGHPEEVKVLESSGHAVLDTAAHNFAKSLTFDPAVVDDAAVSSWTKLILRYKLTEVPFEKNKWVDDVRRYHKQLAAAIDSAEIATLQRKLYTRFIGLSTYVDRYDHVDINETIAKVVTKKTRARWVDFLDVIAAPFMVYDDFLDRYPESELTNQITKDLILLLMDAEADIRIRMLGEKQRSPTHNALLNAINLRLDELNVDNQNLLL